MQNQTKLKEAGLVYCVTKPCCKNIDLTFPKLHLIQIYSHHVGSLLILSDVFIKQLSKQRHYLST